MKDIKSSELSFLRLFYSISSFYHTHRVLCLSLLCLSLFCLPLLYLPLLCLKHYLSNDTRLASILVWVNSLHHRHITLTAFIKFPWHQKENTCHLSTVTSRPGITKLAKPLVTPKSQIPALLPLATMHHFNTLLTPALASRSISILLPAINLRGMNR
jgi:hypothetical protein